LTKSTIVLYNQPIRDRLIAVAKKYLKSIPYEIGQILKLKRQLVDRDMKSFGLQRSQWQTIAHLVILGVPCTQQALLKATDFDRAQLARVLDSFEREGIIRRSQIASDRRLLEIRFTQKGAELSKKVTQFLQKESKIMLKGFNAAEISVMEQLLEKIKNNILLEIEVENIE